MSKRIVLALCALFLVTAAPAYADDDDGRRGRGKQLHGDYDGGGERWYQRSDGRYGDGYKSGKHYKAKDRAKYRRKAAKHERKAAEYSRKAEKYRRKARQDYGPRRAHGRRVVVWQNERRWGPPGHRHAGRYAQRSYRDDHRPRRGYRDRRDDDWAIYAILALQIVDVLNESQRDSYAWAQQRAVSAPIGETIRWNDGGAYGSVVPTREGSDGSGRYCREFQQEVIVGNRNQSGYGVACRQPDGAWQIVSR
ncbi:MAG: hypothetical protein RH942_01295 [Kiloniellaceae bacterium]